MPTYLILVFRSTFSPVPFPSHARKARLPTEWAPFLFRDRFAGPQVVLSGSAVVWYHSFWLLDRLIRCDRYEKCPLILFWCSVLASPQSRSRPMLEHQSFQQNGLVFWSDRDLLVRKWYFQGPQYHRVRRVRSCLVP